MKKPILIILLLFYFVSIFSQQTENNTPIVDYSKSQKILYRGIYNKLRINVPKTDSIQLYDIKNKLTPNDKSGYYKINCTSTRAETKTLVVKSYRDGIRIGIDSIDFKIKNIGSPRLRIKNNSGRNLKMTLEELENAKLEVYITDFLFNHNIKISQYKIKIGSKEIVQVEGHLISKEVFSKIEKLNIGEEILIFDVHYYSSDFSCGKPPSPMFIELIKKR